MNLLLRNLPDHLHKKVQAVAKRHGNSVNREAVSLLEKAVELEGPLALPPLVPLKRKVSDSELRTMIREGRP